MSNINKEKESIKLDDNLKIQIALLNFKNLIKEVERTNTQSQSNYNLFILYKYVTMVM